MSIDRHNHLFLFDVQYVNITGVDLEKTPTAQRTPYQQLSILNQASTHCSCGIQACVHSVHALRSKITLTMNQLGECVCHSMKHDADTESMT